MRSSGGGGSTALASPFFLLHTVLCACFNLIQCWTCGSMLHLHPLQPALTNTALGTSKTPPQHDSDASPPPPSFLCLSDSLFPRPAPPPVCATHPPTHPHINPPIGLQRL